MDKNSKVVHIKDITNGAPGILMDALENVRNGKVTNFILMYTTINENNPEDFGDTINSYWFGKNSCLYILGLVEWMGTKIKDYMRY